MPHPFALFLAKEWDSAGLNSAKIGDVKDSESQALRFLHSRGFSRAIYEPDGNVPPDFLVDGRIAVEVRRMNYTYIDKTVHTEGVESSQIALMRYMKRLLPAFGAPMTGQSWFVRFWFKRPLPPFATLRRDIKHALASFCDGPITDRKIPIGDQFNLFLSPCSTARSNRFVLLGYVDRNAGGWLIPDLRNNIQVCIKEKTEKIARMRTRYPEWWLVLVDHISFGQREPLNVKHDWDKVILINPLKPEEGYEV